MAACIKCKSVELPWRVTNLSNCCSALAYMWNLSEKRANSYHKSAFSGSRTNIFAYSRSLHLTSWITSNSSASLICFSIPLSANDALANSALFSCKVSNCETISYGKLSLWVSPIACCKHSFNFFWRKMYSSALNLFFSCVVSYLPPPTYFLNFSTPSLKIATYKRDLISVYL